MIPPPRSVTVAFWFQLAMVTVLIVYAAMSVADAFHPSGASATLENVLLRVFVGSVPALWLGLTAPWLRRGSQGARALSLACAGFLVLIGLLICCVFVPIAGISENPTNEPHFGEWTNGPGSPVSGWSVTYDVFSLAVVAVILPCATAASLLLLSRSANRFFQLGGHRGGGWQPGGPDPQWPVPAGEHRPGEGDQPAR